MCSVLHLMGYKAILVEAKPPLREAILSRIRKDHAELCALNVSPSAISKRAHLWTVAGLQDLVARAHEHFGATADRKSSARAMIDAVVRGVHASFDDLLLAHAAVTKEADERFGADPDAAPVKGTAITLALRRTRCTIKSSYQKYTTARQDGAKIVEQDPSFAGPLRTLAGWVMDGRFPSMEHAYRNYNKARRQVERKFNGQEAIPHKVISAATILLMKGHYPSAAAAFRGWVQSNHSVSLEAEREPRLKPVESLLAGLLFAKTYKDAHQLCSLYIELDDQATALLPRNSNGASLARTVAGLVVQKRYPSVVAAAERYVKLCAEAEALIQKTSVAWRMKSSLVLIVLKQESTSIVTALEQFERTLEKLVCERVAQGLVGEQERLGTLVIRAMRSKSKNQ